MLGTQPWAEPVLEWRAPLEYGALQDRLQRDAELLTIWPVAPLKPSQPTAIASATVLDRSEVSARCSSPRTIRTFPLSLSGRRPSWFREVVRRAWLPAIYPFWGRQVIHASAAGPSDTNDVIAFTGRRLRASRRPRTRWAAAQAGG